MLRPVDPRGVIYSKTRLRKPYTDQSLRRPPHCKKCMRTANCFISRHPGISSTFTRSPCVFSNHIRKRLAEGHLGSWHPLRVLPLTPTHRCLRLEWCHARGNSTAEEWNQVVFSDECKIQSQQ
ncbi:uncharacterized protein TNCV_2536511 [Trichonephila clavipes]|nr:uncharacterized protein TNCV_2536511 [Trichonephila clavipes]